MSESDGMKVATIAQFFGIRSQLASRVAQISLLGFVAALGFVPGWERLFGFAGFFGFIGFATLIEVLDRNRSRESR